jgi:hypothetical protein
VHVPTQDKSDNAKIIFMRCWIFHITAIPEVREHYFLGFFNTRVGRDVFKPTVWNDSSHEISNDNAVIIVNFTRSKVKESTTQHSYRQNSPDGKIR